MSEQFPPHDPAKIPPLIQEAMEHLHDIIDPLPPHERVQAWRQMYYVVRMEADRCAAEGKPQGGEGASAPPP